MIHKEHTNNNIESFHKALGLKFSVAHPSLWVFLGKKIIYNTIQFDKGCIVVQRSYFFFANHYVVKNIMD